MSSIVKGAVCGVHAIFCIGAFTGTAYAQLDHFDKDAFLSTKPDDLRSAYEALVQGGARNSVLNNMEIATLALKLDDRIEAAEAIDRALLDIKRYYGQTESAQKARSLWYDEGSKEFKGEPYERAMAHYYRGMLDLEKSDFGNAQASFISGFLQDAFSEEEQYSADFALLIFLNAWSLSCNDNEVLAEKRYEEAERLRPDFKRPDKNHDTLVVIETGKSPRKLADGIGHSKLVYRRGKKFKDYGAVIEIDQTYPAYTMEDIFYQAQTRGSRPVDNILDGKINFRNASEQAGDTMVSLGDSLATTSYLTGSGDLGYASSVISLIGGLQLHRASNAKPRADTRYWSGLPDRVHILTYDSKTLGARDVTIRYLGKNDEPIPIENKVIKRIAEPGQCGLAWALSQN